MYKKARANTKLKNIDTSKYLISSSFKILNIAAGYQELIFSAVGVI